MPIKVSVVVATYNHGPGLTPSLRSLDAQTMPTEQFEVIVVDDGSTDDTPAQVRAAAETRPWLRAAAVPHSGSAGRPRNVGTSLARGEYVLYLDPRDELFPEALARAYAYAAEHRADVLVAREVRPQAWETFRFNEPAVADLDEHVLAVLTPYKLYRTAFLRENAIRFPEGGEAMGGYHLNAQAYARARVVSVLADYPCYRPAPSRLRPDDPARAWVAVRRDLRAIARHAPPGPRRDALLMRWYRGCVLDRLGPALLRLGPTDREATVALARAVLLEHFPPHLDAALPAGERPRARLCRAGDLPRLVEIAALDRGVTARPELLDVAWRQGALEVTVVATLVGADGTPVPFQRVGDRVHRVVPDGLLTDDERDVTDLLRGRVELGVRGRDSAVDWPLPSHGRLAFVDAPGGGVVVQGWCTARLYPAAAAYGRPLDERLWDVMVRFTALGHVALRPVPAVGAYRPVGPALVDGRVVVPFAGDDGQLSVDLGRGTPGLVPPGGLTPADVTRGDGRLELRLPPIHLDGFHTAAGHVIVGGVAYPAECRTLDGRSAVRANVPPTAYGQVLVHLVDPAAPTALTLVPGADGHSQPRRLPPPQPVRPMAQHGAAHHAVGLHAASPPHPVRQAYRRISWPVRRVARRAAARIGRRDVQ